MLLKKGCVGLERHGLAEGATAAQAVPRLRVDLTLAAPWSASSPVSVP